jgi:hypothetical protein
MRRDGSRFQSFVRRIPADVRAKAIGNPLAIPLGDEFVFVTPNEGAQAVRFSLRTAEPSEVKTRLPVDGDPTANIKLIEDPQKISLLS